jgi:hypothetical protein
MKRADLLNLLEASLAAGQAAYARKTAQRYLNDWPGDLGVQYALARATLADGDSSLAVKLLETLTAADPEDFKAHRLLGDTLKAQSKLDFAAYAYANAHVCDGLNSPISNPPQWATASRAAYLAERIGDWETARRESETALKADTPSPLPSLIHLAGLWHAGQFDLALPLAQGFHARWPRVIGFKLCLAECLLHTGDSTRALELLHDAAAQDTTGRVATRHWGENHAYREMWTTTFSAASLPGPLPFELIKALGLNRLKGEVQKTKSQDFAPRASNLQLPTSNFQLPTSNFPLGERPTSNSQSLLSHIDSPLPNHFSSVTNYQPLAASHTAEELADIQSQLDAIAEQLHSKQVSPQLPLTNYYLILTSRTRLLQAYGPEGLAAIEPVLNSLAANAGPRAKMTARVVYVDDPASLHPFGLKPVNPGNAWDIKMLLRDLVADLKLKQTGIGALLIVGGEDIVPFHRLPNPTDDTDAEVPSDNPYATPDENYFVPEWPVGRIPSGKGSNPAPLIRALKIAAGTHSPNSKPPTRSWFARLLDWFFNWKIEGESARSFGYSANVWKNASLAVYTTIGDPRELLTCPPHDAAALPVEGLAPARFSYFNLHGVEDGPEWYGQRSYDDSYALPEYPVALRPADVVNSGRAPVIVFSEACYGANIIGKTPEDALCLRFLDSGTRALVASTKIAYGSVSSPLIGADLLGKLFWQNVNAGVPVGEALRRAKLQMAQEMHERQGFLDGEDQKTLLSFILYGDPLMTAPGVKSDTRSGAKRWVPKFTEPPPPVCDRAEAESNSDIPPEVVAQIKNVVAQYLPSMRDAEWRVAHAHANCDGKHHACPTAQLSKGAPARRISANPHNTVVTLSKTVNTSTRSHPHYARVTLDDKGAVVKVAVSR